MDADLLARDIRDGVAAPEPDETIEVFRLTLSEALALVANQKIHDGKTLIGLLLYDAARRSGRLLITGSEAFRRYFYVPNNRKIIYPEKIRAT